jgi:hypothetical protein
MMDKDLADALAKRGRVWGERNKEILSDVRKGTARNKIIYRPSVPAVNISLSDVVSQLQVIHVSGSVTHIPPAE